MIGEIDKKTINTYKGALSLLIKKNIPVYFYHRPDMIDISWYTEEARRRIRDCDSFNSMYQNINKYEKDFKQLFGEKYSVDYVQKIGKIPQVVKIDERYCHEDCREEFVNVVNGERITTDSPNVYSKTIHVYGRCGVFGYAVEDNETIPSQLQRILMEKKYNYIQVKNHGLWGGEDYMIDQNFFYDLQNYSEGDVVIFYRYHFEKYVMDELEKFGLYYKDLTNEWHSFPESKWCFYDKPGHMNATGYKNIAEIIARDLIKTNMEIRPVEQGIINPKYISLYNKFIDEKKDNGIQNDINKYLSDIKTLNKSANGKYNGAIVMNCNPFTWGHKYLIEVASKEVDYLYIFVVQEDKSFFSFEDRLKMVREGTREVHNAIVVPSGKYIISAFTFPEYFMKEYVNKKDIDISVDVNIFGKYIAPALSIKRRYVGEEKKDLITQKYNLTMKSILPKYGVAVLEIPRKTLENGDVISATEVRLLIKKKEIKSLQKYIPKSTYDIVIEKYL